MNGADTYTVLTERREESFLQHEIVFPEPLTFGATLRPQSAVWIQRHVARHVAASLRVGVLQLVAGDGCDVRQPVWREEADSDEDDGCRQHHRTADEQKIGARHVLAFNDHLHLHIRHVDDLQRINYMRVFVKKSLYLTEYTARVDLDDNLFGTTNKSYVEIQ